MTGAVSLPEELRGWSDDDLATMLAARPDLITPVPVDLDQLASRACTRSSLSRMIDRLNRIQLGVLEALALLPAPTHPDQVLAAVPAASPATLTDLRRLALVWGPDERLRCPGLLPTLLPYPGGLGPDLRTVLFNYSPARLAGLARDIGVTPDPGANVHQLVAAITGELTRPGRISELLAQAGPAALEAARHLSVAGPTGRLPDPDRQTRVEDAHTALDALLARGLLLAVDTLTVVLPREVGWVLRAGVLHPEPTALAEPVLVTSRRDPEVVDRAAGGAALEFLARVEHLLQLWEQHPPAVLKTLGLGVRELRRTASALGVDERLGALVIEMTAAAGLVAVGPDREYLPSVDADAWLLHAPATRWGSVVNAWLHSVRTPSLAGSRDDAGKLRAALSFETERGATPELRRLVLGVLAGLEPGTCAPAEQVGRRLGWLRPLRWAGPGATAAVAATLEEASQLGLLGLGGLSSAAQVLVTGAGMDAAVAALAQVLPEPSSTVLVQADLTAVAPGPLEPALARTLAKIADVESRGSATVYRFAPTSIRRGLDSGMTAEEVHRLLAQHSATPIPQPLTYLVDDVARRHGKVRVGHANTYIRSDDTAAIDSLMADPGAAQLRLHRLADTVVLSLASRDDVLATLRELGLAPVEETAAGLAVTRSSTGPKRAQRPRLSRREVHAPSPAALGEAVRRMRAGDRAQAARPADGAGALGRSGSITVVEQLTRAIAQRQQVWIGYLDHQGGAHDRVVLPLTIGAGRLSAFDADRGAPADFPLHRITGVAQVES